MTSSASLLIEDVFEVLEQDPDGKKFEKVSRFHCKSEYFEFEMVLDVNIAIYPLEIHDKFNLGLVTTLSLDGVTDDGFYDQSGQPNLADKYEYVMYGKLYKYREDTSSGQLRIEVYISFGGLLMSLKGDPNHMEGLKLDSRLYLLMRKV
mmetsp:Transcript_26649/g.36785  ORF Transcript_26649/g.36785 Transcript_26649/m.36785 type:complete len:149 (-) Transcript_26649:96-542(-)|eukprot:CAMPEP_0196584922 /NCGR_PEP_ID=MMETSP1081-20130531/48990_1 /TAXON_ID=36882 /ORGANISM="Pyramimonas amylifera, Strain CCMP720" /LENGTH=148 /DNA_ID=CAMNT_0041906309 /DNA_START=246 /DNA_END=692 /DNA_ORIENTATION=+